MMEFLAANFNLPTIIVGAIVFGGVIWVTWHSPQTRRWLWWLRRGRLQWRLRRVQRMPLTEAHLRYLLAIYEVSRTKPSVVRIMNLLMSAA